MLPRRVRDYRREWLDELTLSGEFAWGRLWGGGGSAIRVTPIGFVPREHLDEWLALTEPPTTDGLSGPARDLLNALTSHGPMFPQNLPKAADLVPAHVEMGLADLLARGLVTCDSFAALRQMITPPSRRRHALRPVGRWSRFRAEPPARSSTDEPTRWSRGNCSAAPASSSAARSLREKLPVTWSALTRVYRRMELRGEVRGGRFVARLLRRAVRAARSRRAAAQPPPRGPAHAGLGRLRRPAQLPGHPHARTARRPDHAARAVLVG